MWTEQEILLLKGNYSKRGKKWCCEKLSKTEGSVRSLASRLKLKLDKDSKFFKDFQRRASKSKTGKKRPKHSAIMKQKYIDDELNIPNNTKHGLSRTKAYRIWSGMMARCYRDKDDSYLYYGARGIKVCKKWHNVKIFKKWFDKNYKTNLTIERKDYNSDYKPSNCIFITMSEQGRNRRNIKLTKEKVEIIRRMHREGIRQINISHILNINYKTINSIILNKSWNFLSEKDS